MPEASYSKNPLSALAEGRPRRRFPRHWISASAEIVDMNTRMRLSARISEIGILGCYIDMLNPLPVDTQINLRIVRDAGTFLTSAKVIYTHPGFGMGAVFVDPPADQKAVLEEWLSQLDR